jgi:hypothetical protein
MKLFESPSANHPENMIHGAVKGNQADLADFAPEDLPLIVWLKGDESFAGDFCIDADQAMKILGIKRSRLTQISGKELRVGRMRQGRYIRPVYRQSDLNDYLEWTRPTATHIKSSDVLMQAATELRSGTKEVVDQLADQMRLSSTEIQETITKVSNETYRIQRESIRQSLEQDESLRDYIERRSGMLQDIIGSALQDSGSKFENSTSKISDDVSLIREQIQSRTDSIDQTLRSIMHSLDLSNEIIQHQSQQSEVAARSIAKTSEESFELAFENFAAIRETMDQQARFHRGVAEALARIIEVQRELLQIRNIAMLNNGKSLPIRRGSCIARKKAPMRRRGLSNSN